ncbi:MAG: hypothetical protein BGN87_12115 [Rhizobiales bacterium 65-79]|jgi:hypothetical protein|nr:hypothetical protein [Hyphomicrobiales bacterium]OJU06023.1 MAG: hypothetical protein BGN87_12115 [Rhizobiales bacterium 65-79]
MIEALRLGRTVVDVPCTIEIEHTWESLHAHVELEGLTVEPGDEVHVHGDEIVVPFGERLKLRRTATVTRASAPERLWVRMTGDFEFMELLEFSFSSGEKL